jgi:hypothetical protein
MKGAACSGKLGVRPSFRVRVDTRTKCRDDDQPDDRVARLT